jgi:acyl carrier protein
MVQIPDDEHARQALIEYIRREFPAGASVGPEDDLMRGVIDSIGVFNVVGFIETRFGIVFEDRDLTAKNFKTVNTILALVKAIAAKAS